MKNTKKTFATETALCIADVLQKEKPTSILQMSGGEFLYGDVFTAFAEDKNHHTVVIEKKLLQANPSPISVTNGEKKQQKTELLDVLRQLPVFDVIFISNLLEKIETSFAFEILALLRTKVTKQLLLSLPQEIAGCANENEVYQKYHPVLFSDFDFSYQVLGEGRKKNTLYSIFKKEKYEMIPPFIPQTPFLPTRPMRIAFILPNKDLTGGMKALLEQVKQQALLGHKVYVYIKHSNEQCALPEWSGLKERDIAGQKVIAPEDSYLEEIAEVDVIVLGWMRQIPDFVDARVPVVLWEQGSELLFGDCGNVLSSKSKLRVSLHHLYRSPVDIFAVSPIIQTILKARYGRECQLLPPSIDTNLFMPKDKEAKTATKLLLVGNPQLEFKNFALAFKAIELALQKGVYFEIAWAAQKQPTEKLNFPVQYHVNVSQNELAVLYQKADIFLFTSLYESFGLPPLEAMATGTAVVATNCGGIETYAQNGENALVYRQGEPAALADALVELSRNEEKRTQMGVLGRKTALKYSPEKTALLLEKLLQELISR